ncbi:MAG: TolC family protein [Candidatus Latescibacter sp.]|nr:TolC family protein [Candidatus Latescibacter sp.]
MKDVMLIVSVALLTALEIQTGWSQESYEGLTQDKAVTVALQKNRDLLNAKDEVQKSDYRITEAASGAFPQITGSWNYNRNLKPQVFVITFPDSTGKLTQNRLKIGTDNSANLGVNLTQPLYVGGKVGTALQAAKIYRNLSGETARAVKQNVILGVSQAFNSALLAKELQNIASESLEQARKHLENVEHLKAAGAATEYDLLRARVNVSNMKPKLLEAENNVTLSLLKLKQTMGVDPYASISLTGVFTEPDTTLLALAEARTALEKRPEIKIGKYTTDLQEKNVQVVKADFFPTLTAGTSFAFMGNFDTFRYNAREWNPYWFATLNLSFPIFDGLRNYSKYRQAKIDYLKSRTDYLKTRDSVVIEVYEGVLNLKMALKQIESQKMNIQEAQRAVELSVSLFSNGKATQLEVLDAQLALEVARTNMASALYNGTVAAIVLRKSLGLLDLDS